MCPSARTLWAPEGSGMASVCIQTDLFPTAPEGDLELCNGQPGSAAAEWVRAVLVREGIACRAIMQEDYGWGFWLEHQCAVWVAVSFSGGVQGDQRDPPHWWLEGAHQCSLFSLKQRKLRRAGAELASRVNALLIAAARAESEITVVSVEGEQEAA